MVEEYNHEKVLTDKNGVVSPVVFWWKGNFCGGY